MHSQSGLKPTKVYKAPNGSEFVLIKPVPFKMGSDVSRGGYVDVRLTEYWIQTTEVTNRQYEKVMGERKRPKESNSDDQPVTGLSFNQIREYIKKLSAKSGRTYRLPTAAEFEYAARGGYEKMNYPWGPENVPIDQRAQTSLMQRKDKTAAVKSFPPNFFGLYDMVGNAAEVIEDTADEVLPVDGDSSLLDPIFVRSKPDPLAGYAQGGSYGDSYPFVWALFSVYLSDDFIAEIQRIDVGFRVVISEAKLRKIEVPRDLL